MSVSESNHHPARELFSRSELVPTDFLRSVFMLELLNPSNRLWVSSPWIGNVSLLDNSDRSLSTLCPDWPVSKITMAKYFQELARRGTHIVIVHNGAASNESFLSALTRNERLTKNIKVILDKELHDKGITGDNFVISGSMNFTYRGINTNRESVLFRTDPEVIAQRKISHVQRWGDA